jgi:hypothetical protein
MTDSWISIICNGLLNSDILLVRDGRVIKGLSLSFFLVAIAQIVEIDRAFPALGNPFPSGRQRPATARTIMTPSRQSLFSAFLRQDKPPELKV